MNAIDSLRLDRGIPPRVEQENVIRGVQRDAGAGGLKRDEHHRGTLGALERLHGLEAVQSHASELVTRQVRETLRKSGAHAVEQHHELRKDDDLVTAADDLGEFLDEQRNLAGVGQRRVQPRQHVGIAAHLAQACEQREEAKGLLTHGRTDVVTEAVETLGANARVFGALHIGERAQQVDLDLLWKLGGDGVFGAAQDERRELRAEAIQRAGAVGVERSLKRDARAEQSGKQETEDRPQIELAVFQRRAGEHDPMAGADRETRLRDLRIGVLDELAFVEHGVTELVFVEQRAVLAELRVAREPDDRLLARREVVAGLQDINREVRIKTQDLLAPHRHHAGRTHDDARTIRQRPRRKQREHLQRFTETHFVGQQTVATDVAEVMHPLYAATLIRTQQLGQRGIRRGGGKHILAPGLQLGGEREFDAAVAVEGKNQVRRKLARAARLGGGAMPRADGSEALDGQRHDADVGNDHRGRRLAREQGNFLVGQHAFAGFEDPAEVEPLPVRLALARGGHGFDGDFLGALEQLAGLRVELDGEQFFPRGQRCAQEVGNLHHRGEDVEARDLVVGEVGFARVGREADQLRAFAGADGRMTLAGRLRGLSEGGHAFLVGIDPVGLEREAVRRRRENENERA
ncbi:hypothetical protein RAHE111665_14065 [Rariglobus hedericola]